MRIWYVIREAHIARKLYEGIYFVNLYICIWRAFFQIWQYRGNLTWKCSLIRKFHNIEKVGFFKFLKEAFIKSSFFLRGHHHHHHQNCKRNFLRHLAVVGRLFNRAVIRRWAFHQPRWQDKKITKIKKIK